MANPTLAQMLAQMQAQLTALQSAPVAATVAAKPARAMAFSGVEFVKGTFKKHQPATAAEFATAAPGVYAVVKIAGSDYGKWIRADAFAFVKTALK